MNVMNRAEFSVDNASILFLSLFRPYHNNNFRFAITLTETICPETLQKAVNRIFPRFPSVIAGFHPGFFRYKQVSAAKPPVVQPDPGLLRPMGRDEFQKCAFRVYYRDNTISIELFHALTDGHGAITVLTTLTAEYLQLLHNVVSPVGPIRMDTAAAPQAWELEDSYIKMADVKPQMLPSRFSYLPARSEGADWQVRNTLVKMDTNALLSKARRSGVSLNTFLTGVLASSLMELQIRERGTKKLRPVRIMVPINLRKMIGSRTLRNFSLYSLPTMEVSHQHLATDELCRVMDAQLKEQLSQQNQSAMVSHNVRIQNVWYFKILPWMLKAAVLRLGYRFFGESNSSMTLTNLGRIALPEEMTPYVTDFHCLITPRVTSPYGCTVLSYGDTLYLNMSRFCPEDRLGAIFFRKLENLIRT